MVLIPKISTFWGLIHVDSAAGALEPDKGNSRPRMSGLFCFVRFLACRFCCCAWRA
jgi:hypothetical protein